MNYLLISLPIIVIIFQTTDSFFIRHKQRVFFRGQQSVRQVSSAQVSNSNSDDNNLEDNSISTNREGSARTLSLVLNWLTENKPEFIPVLTEFMVKNPRILEILTGGSGDRTKRDTSSKVEYNDESDNPFVIRRVFDFVLDNDSDDCFKKYVCGMIKSTSSLESRDDLFMDLMEENESTSARHECKTGFTKCSFKEYKTRDVLNEMTGTRLQPIGAKQSTASD